MNQWIIPLRPSQNHSQTSVVKPPEHIHRPCGSRDPGAPDQLAALRFSSSLRKQILFSRNSVGINFTLPLFSYHLSLRERVTSAPVAPVASVVDLPTFDFRS